MRYWKPRPVPADTLVGIVVATYNQAMLSTLGSIAQQTHQDFVCVVVHDGPPTKLFDRAAEIFKDDGRFEFSHTETRQKVFGHNCRRRGFDYLLNHRAIPKLLCTTNGDNYFVPTFVEALAHAALNAPAGWAICDMVHSHKHWQPMTTRMQRGHVDAACWMARSELMTKAGRWTDDFAADWHFLDRLQRAAGPPAKVPHTLVVHN